MPLEDYQIAKGPINDRAGTLEKIQRAMILRRFPELAGSANPVLELMRLATRGANQAAARSPGADFLANGGDAQVDAQNILQDAFNVQNFIPPGFIDRVTGLHSQYQGNMLPNPRSAR